jgi:hypothetical protein
MTAHAQAAGTLFFIHTLFTLLISRQ